MMFFTGQGIYCHFISRLLGAKGSQLSSISPNCCFLSLLSKDRKEASKAIAQIATS